MTIEFMLGLLIIIDIVLCLAIIFLVRVANREMKKKFPEIDEKAFSEFRKLIEDSRCSTDYLFQALNEVKKIGYALDGKEGRLRTLIEESDAKFEDRKPGDSSRGEKYEDVIKMAGQGLTEKEIADTLNLTEGEISLILDLHRKKNENFAPYSSIQ